MLSEISTFSPALSTPKEKRKKMKTKHGMRNSNLDVLSYVPLIDQNME